MESVEPVEVADDPGATRWVWVLLAAVVASAAVVVWVALQGESALGHGGPHPRLPAMQVGGPGAERVGGLLVAGALFGLFQIAFFGACFALGMRRGAGLGSLARPIAGALGLYAAMWLALVVAYARYAADPAAATLWFGFPAPTAILFFGLWPLPLLFAGIYLRGFDRFVVSERDLENFYARIAELRSSQASDGRKPEP